jgi:hypothetical protein
MSGKEVGIWLNVNPHSPIDIQHLPSGNYVLKIKTAEGITEQQLIVR